NRLERERAEVACLYMLQDLEIQLADARWGLADHRCEIDEGEAEALEERLEPQRLVGEVVTLADLDKSSAHAQQVEALFEELTRERVEHDVDTLAVGPAKDVAHELIGARVGDMVDPLSA